MGRVCGVLPFERPAGCHAFGHWRNPKLNGCSLFVDLYCEKGPPAILRCFFPTFTSSPKRANKVHSEGSREWLKYLTLPRICFGSYVKEPGSFNCPPRAPLRAATNGREDRHIPPKLRDLVAGGEGAIIGSLKILYKLECVHIRSAHPQASLAPTPSRTGMDSGRVECHMYLPDCS